MEPSWFRRRVGVLAVRVSDSVLAYPWLELYVPDSNNPSAVALMFEKAAAVREPLD